MSASGYLSPSLRPFFVALPKDRAPPPTAAGHAGHGVGSAADFRRQVQAVDAGVLRHLRVRGEKRS